MKVFNRKFIALIIFINVILIGGISLANSAFSEVDRKKLTEVIEEEENFLTLEEQKTIDYINEYRRQHGLSELKVSSKLQEVAKLKAKDIVENEYFAHNSERLGTPFEMLKENDVYYSIAGENLAGNTTPENAFEAWINSPAHRENILEEEYEYTGIYVLKSPIYGNVYVQLFIGI